MGEAVETSTPVESTGPSPCVVCAEAVHDRPNLVGYAAQLAGVERNGAGEVSHITEHLFDDPSLARSDPVPGEHDPERSMGVEYQVTPLREDFGLGWNGHSRAIANWGLPL